jgi:hypothetical protein
MLKLIRSMGTRGMAFFLAATLVMVVASCAWMREHPAVSDAADAALANGDLLCYSVTDDQGERRICSSAVALARAADALARSIDAAEGQACPAPSPSASSVSSAMARPEVVP